MKKTKTNQVSIIVLGWLTRTLQLRFCLLFCSFQEVKRRIVDECTDTLNLHIQNRKNRFHMKQIRGNYNLNCFAQRLMNNCMNKENLWATKFLKLLLIAPCQVPQRDFRLLKFILTSSCKELDVNMSGATGLEVGQEFAVTVNSYII